MAEVGQPVTEDLLGDGEDGSGQNGGDAQLGGVTQVFEEYSDDEPLLYFRTLEAVA